MNPIKGVANLKAFLNGMILYHGGITAVEHIDLTKSRQSLDFGKGFYTTSNYAQACRWSRLKYDRDKNNPVRSKAVSKYLLNNTEGLKVKEFQDPTGEWLEFIVANRNSRSLIHTYDLVIGPIANDTTLLVVNSFINGLYGHGESAVQMAISLLKPEILESQYAFCTKRAISLLSYTGCDYL